MDQPPAGQDQHAVSAGLPRCYRHPGRQTGISCTRCERPICPECMVSASVGFHCPECVRRGSGTGSSPVAARPRTVAGGTIAADPRLVTKILIGINLAVFVAVLATGGERLVDDLSLWSIGVGAQGQWYRLVTSIFLHQQFFHIGFNMLSLWWIGGPLESRLGRARYLTIYVIAGLAGSALTYLIGPLDVPSLGASGAIFGLFGATAVLVRRLNYDMRPVIALLVINLVITFTWANIAWQAHIGGLVAGVMVAIAMVYAPRERRALVQYGTSALVLLVVIVMIVARTLALS